MEIRMIFRDIELSDRDWLDKKFKEDNKKACEFCFANNYLWRKYFPTQIATEGDCVILRYYAENDAMYVFPIGNGEKKKAPPPEKPFIIPYSFAGLVAGRPAW